MRDDANCERQAVMKATRALGDKAAAQGVGAKGEVTPQTLAFMMEEAHRAYAETPRSVTCYFFKNYLLLGENKASL